MKNSGFKTLEDVLNKIPSITTRNAKRIAFLLSTDKTLNSEIISALTQIQAINKCRYCNALTQSEICDNCNENKKRKIMIINSYDDQINLEKNNINDFHFFVLDNKGKIDINNINLDRLDIFLERSNLEEVFIFISPTIEGKILTEKISKLCKSKKIFYSTLMIGIPFGASIDSIDPITLREALKKREKSN